MGYYQTFLEKQQIEKNKNYEKQKQRAKEYYWKNRDYVLERQRTKKFQTREYYKQWYQKNKQELNQIRYGDKSKVKNTKGLSTKSHKKIVEKKIFTPKDFILFG